MPEKPELKQFGDLLPADFERHPVWIGVHTADYDEPWYDDTNEETFRPWTGALPVSPDEGMFLVRASFEARDGRRYAGFLTPAAEYYLGTIQPYLFAGSRQVYFWGGITGVSDANREAFRAALGEDVQAFPLRFAAEPGLATGVVAGEISRFYGAEDMRPLMVPRRPSARPSLIATILGWFGYRMYP